jgi:hypothetical protein
MHLDPAWLGPPEDQLTLPTAARWYATGRDALHALVRFGATELGWKRLRYPSYYCFDALRPLAGGPLELEPYLDGPVRDAVSIDDSLAESRPGDVALVVNYFGLRSNPRLTAPIALIEDHTHDPDGEWARSSTADYAFASLRKTLPIPDGAVSWSPRGATLPAVAPVTAEAAGISARRLAGMFMKSFWIAGHGLEKQTFREAIAEAEEALATAPESAMTGLSRAILGSLSPHQWSTARARNHAAFVATFDGGGVAAVLPPDPGATPFCVTLLFARALDRDHARSMLMDRHVYPAILWPQVPTLDGDARETDIALSARLLMIHCDLRSSEAEMRAVATLASEACRPA